MSNFQVYVGFDPSTHKHSLFTDRIFFPVDFSSDFPLALISEEMTISFLIATEENLSRSFWLHQPRAKDDTIPRRPCGPASCNTPVVDIKLLTRRACGAVN
ncbi:hypothetical protein Hdeb2414_s0012g00390731 [Helianthus debilis subsp. tardiflorus]